MDKFKHLKDTAYPFVDNINVYAYENNFDYTKWDENTIVRMLSVPWDSDYKNVVDFKTDEERDSWIEDNTKEKFVFETEQYVQPDGSIRLPVPFNVCARYNYIAVDFPNAPVDFGSDTPRVNKAFYFINDAKRLSPSTTELIIAQDYWTTYINDVEISYMMLDRGHAPMQAAPTPQEFLSNPSQNYFFLSTPDVNFSNAGEKINAIDDFVFNGGEMYCVLACSIDLYNGDFGTFGDTMTMPSIPYDTTTGAANYQYVAIHINQFGTFLANVSANADWIKSGVNALYYISSDLLVFIDGKNKFGVDIYRVHGASAKKELMRPLTISDFGYPDIYNKITKLYTSPYALLEITDEKGGKHTINIEDIGAGGNISLWQSLNLISPGAGIDAHIVNINNDGAGGVVFKNGSNDIYINTPGGWTDFVISWEIPQFAIFESAHDYNEWRSYFGKKQNIISLNAAYDSAIASNNSAYDNAVDSAIASDAGDNSSINSSTYINTLNKDLTENMAIGSMISSRASSFASAWNSYEAPALQFMSGAISTIPTAISNIGAGFIAGGPAGVASGAMSYGTTMLGSAFSSVGSQEASVRQTQINDIAFNLVYGINPEHTPALDADGVYSDFYRDTNEYFLAMYTDENGNFALRPNSIEYNKLNLQLKFSDATTRLNNKLTEISSKNGDSLVWGGDITSFTVNPDGSPSESIGRVIHGNSKRTKEVSNENAQRTKDVSNSAIVNSRLDSDLAQPIVTGQFSSNEHELTRPLGLFVSLKRQSESAISAAGDQMLRFGYTYDKAWTVTSLQVMKHFTFWQASEIWLAGNTSVCETARKNIETMFTRGVTVWDVPESIEAVSIRDNIE